MSDRYVLQPAQDAWVNIVERATGAVVDRAFGRAGARQKLAVWNRRGRPDDPRSTTLEDENTRLRRVVKALLSTSAADPEFDAVVAEAKRLVSG